VTGMRLTMMVALLALLQGAQGQDKILYFHGPFEGASFTEFAEAVEGQTGIRFFYKESWVREIRVDLSPSGRPLLPVLDSLLQGTGLNYFLDEWDHLFLTDTVKLMASLPAFTPVSAKPAEVAEPDPQELTLAERLYIDGRKDRVPEVVQVGKAESSINGRNALVTGRILDGDSGEPLIGATVFIPSLSKGTATGLDGRFSLLLKPGSYEVECNNMGMNPLRFTLLVHSDGDVNLSMTRTLIALDEVVVTAGQHDHVRGSQMGFERLNYSILKQVPLVMGERDIINVVKLLPGVQSVGEGAAGFNVRGSSADQNMIYIDKVPVYNSAHLFGFFTSFSPEIVRDFHAL
jgi:hypothetical protein